MIRISRAMLTIMVVATIGAVASAQVQLGVQKFASYGGGPADKINLGSLNVHYQVPVRHKAGRGLAFNFDLSLDSSVWVPVTSGSSKTWGLLANLGWSASSVDIGFLQDNFSSDSQFDYDCVVYYEGVGSGHGFPQCAAFDYRNGIDYPISNSVTTDGSGYTLSYDPFVTGVGQLTTVVGSAIIPRNTTPLGPGVKAGSDIDRNGNEITANSSGTFTDTLGTTALTQSGGCTTISNCTPYVMSYTTPTGGATNVTVTFLNYTVKSNFGCSGITEFPATTISLVDKITLPDGTFYKFTYEATPGFAGDVTARVASVKLPTGATTSYSYSGGHNGIECGDGSTAGFTRTSPDGTWTYARTLGTGNASTTTVTDPQGNQSVINFQKDSATTNNTLTFYETYRNIYQGTSGGGTLLMTTFACYNNNANGCPNPTSVSSPITKTDYYTQHPGLSGSTSETTINSYGLPTDHKDFDFGTVLQREIVYTYPTNLGNIKAFWQTTTTKDPAGNIIAQTTNNYDQTAVVATSGTPQHVSVGSNPRGNLTSSVSRVNSSKNLTKSYTYFDTGNVDVATDVNNVSKTYTYGACGNSFATHTSNVGLTTSATWNCAGGVQTSATDESSNTTFTNYTQDPFWRPDSVTDALGNVTNNTYTGQTQAESVLTFNSGASAVDTLTTLDSQGRAFLTQTRKAPGSSNFDSVETFYDALGRTTGTSLPYVGTAGQTTAAGASPKTALDPYGRATQITDTGGASTTFSYTGNLALVTVGPAPTGENTKRRQLAYDGLGRLTEVCEMTSGSGSGTCDPGGVSQTGYWTKYTYDPLNNLTSVTQNAQGTAQTRSFAYDGLSRMTSETNPESGTATYIYDSSNSNGCVGTFNGDLVQAIKASGLSDCFYYDGLHRLTDVGNNDEGAGGMNPCKRFRYDNSSGYPGSTKPSGVANTLGRLAEAATDNCGNGGDPIMTDEWFSYSPRGEPTDAWESTPNSGGYYHSTSAYWANGAAKTLTLTGLPTITYGADGEGRTSTVSASTGQNPVTGTTYSTASQVTNVTLGSADTDAFTFDPNTLRMTQYKYTINGSSEIGNLTWNPNASLKTLAITDPLNSADAQTCNYVHDDLGRISSANCGSVWSQTFTYDAFGNITKSGSITWQPGYSSATNHYTLGGTSYDSDGNLLNDSAHTYIWNAYGRPATIDAIALTYDAFDRMAEQNVSGTLHQIMYSPTGVKLAIFGGQTLQQGFVHLPGGATAQYHSAGLGFYRHPDWLGSERLETGTNHSLQQDTAYAPFGENYSALAGGNGDLSFTVANKDTLFLQYDFLLRQYAPKQGRWESPDPAGLTAADSSDPQTWNRYAYVGNRPLDRIDPLGLDGCDDWGMCDGGSWGGWDGNFGESLGFPTGITIVGQASGSFNRCDFFACGTGTSGINNFHQETDANGNVWDVGDYPGEMTCQPGGVDCAVWNAVTQIWDPAPQQASVVTPINPKQIVGQVARATITNALCGSSMSNRILKSMRNGAVIGAATGAYTGFVSGEIFFGLVSLGTSGAGGAALGGFVGGVFGAGRGVFTGFAMAEACQAAGAY